MTNAEATMITEAAAVAEQGAPVAQELSSSKIDVKYFRRLLQSSHGR